MRATALLLTLSLVLAVAPVSPAGEDEDAAAAQAGGDALLARVVEEQTLEPGTWWYAICLGPTRNAGTVMLSLEAAPPESGAAWRVVFDMRFDVGEGLRVHRTQTCLLARDLSLVSFEASHDMDVGNEDEQWEATGRRQGDRWLVQARFVKGSSERSGTLEAVATPRSLPIAAILLLARHLDRAEPQTWRFTYLALDLAAWGLPQEPQEEAAQVDVEMPCVVRLGEAREVEHRGETVRAHALHLAPEGPGLLGEGEDLALDLGVDGRLLTIADAKGGPGRMVLAADEAEAKKPLAEAEPVDPESPMGKVLVLLHYQAKAVHAEALDAVLDWEELRTYSPLSLEETYDEPRDLAAFREKLVEVLQNERNTIPKARVEALSSLLQEEIEGDVATVRLPDTRLVYRLRKSEKGWRIVNMPRLR